MDVEARLGHLIKKVEEQRSASHKRLRDYRRKAFWLRTSAVVMAAAITVLLGLEGLDAEVSTVVKNAALVLGATVTVLNAWNAFFDYRALWVTNAVSMFRAQRLREKIDYYAAGRSIEEIRPSDVDEFAAEFDELVGDDHQRWIGLRASGLGQISDFDDSTT